MKNTDSIKWIRPNPNQRAAKPVPVRKRTKLKVVAADFLNSLPLTIEVAEDEFFDFEYVVPSEGARQLVEEEADIASFRSLRLPRLVALK